MFFFYLLLFIIHIEVISRQHLYGTKWPFVPCMVEKLLINALLIHVIITCDNYMIIGICGTTLQRCRLLYLNILVLLESVSTLLCRSVLKAHRWRSSFSKSWLACPCAIYWFCATVLLKEPYNVISFIFVVLMLIRCMWVCYVGLFVLCECFYCFLITPLAAKFKSLIECVTCSVLNFPQRKLRSQDIKWANYRMSRFSGL